MTKSYVIKTFADRGLGCSWRSPISRSLPCPPACKRADPSAPSDRRFRHARDRQDRGDGASEDYGAEDCSECRRSLVPPNPRNSRRSHREVVAVLAQYALVTTWLVHTAKYPCDRRSRHNASIAYLLPLGQGLRCRLSLTDGRDRPSVESQTPKRLSRCATQMGYGMNDGPKSQWKRVVVKLSGEALQGGQSHGLDPLVLNKIAVGSRHGRPTRRRGRGRCRRR